MFAVFDLAQLPPGHYSSKGTVHTSHFPHIYLVSTIDKSPLASDLSRAQCSPFPAPSSVPHLHTLLATLVQHSPDRGGHIYKVSRHAEACVTPCTTVHCQAGVAHLSHYLACRICTQP